jgi:hypothetical protein
LLSDRARNERQRTRMVQRLQHGYGNGYVTRLVQRAIAAESAPPASVKLDPGEDPNFVSVQQNIGQNARREKQHPSARSAAAEAKAAAQGPPNDVASQAAASQMDKMAQQ